MSGKNSERQLNMQLSLTEIAMIPSSPRRMIRAMARLPVAPTRAAVKLRGDYSSAAADFRLPQNYDNYSADEHAIWRTLFERQSALMADHAAPEFTAGLRLLGVDAHRIPVLEEASERL